MSGGALEVGGNRGLLLFRLVIFVGPPALAGRLGRILLVSAIFKGPMPMPDVVLYSRKGCHLCEVVKESLGKLSRRAGFAWTEVDVDGDDDLRRRFNDEVPVVFIDGRKAFKYRMDEQEFLRKLQARS